MFFQIICENHTTFFVIFDHISKQFNHISKQFLKCDSESAHDLMSRDSTIV